MRRLLAVLTSAVALAFGSPAARAVELSQFSLRFGWIGTNYDRHLSTSYFDYTTRLDLGSGAGPFVGVEYRPTPLIGLELSIARLPLDARLRVTRLVPISFNPLVLEEQEVSRDDGSYTLLPFTLAVLFHPLRGRRTDVYIGPQVGRVGYEIDVGDLGSRSPEMAYGAKAGVELRLGESAWAIAAEIAHLEIHHEGTDHDLYGNLGVTTGALLLVFHGR